MKYRRNIDTKLPIVRQVKEHHYTQPFLQKYYAGKINFELLRLLAILDVEPAIEALRSIEPSEDIRKTIQLERLDAIKLASTHPELLKNVSISAAKYLLFHLPLPPRLDPLTLVALSAVLTIVGRAGAYLESFKEESAWPVSSEGLEFECQNIIDTLSKCLSFFGLTMGEFPENAIDSCEAAHAIGLNILDILLGRCCQCGEDHEEQAAEFNLLKGIILSSNKLGNYSEIREQLIKYIYQQVGVIV